MADSSEVEAPRRTATLGELLAESTDFLDFLQKRSQVDLVDEGPDLMEVFIAERHGGGWVPPEDRLPEYPGAVSVAEIAALVKHLELDRSEVEEDSER
ncbi:MAG: hypothetical protein OXN44_14390 [Acidimicrobiaceae bacterium]|nr:hypothetical protein [Acidimicrobiaceae bacterium]MDE0605673.1 hypothetical protein [Acidimicrobiaceae bacterium]